MDQQITVSQGMLNDTMYTKHLTRGMGHERCSNATAFSDIRRRRSVAGNWEISIFTTEQGRKGKRALTKQLDELFQDLSPKYVIFPRFLLWFAQRLCAYEADTVWGGWASPCGHSAAWLVRVSTLVLLPPWRVSTFSGILTGNVPRPTASRPLSPGVMGDEDVSCHSTQDREWVNPGFIISGVAGDRTSVPPPPRVNMQPGLPYPQSWLQASKPVTFLFYLHMVFASFDVDSYTQGGRDFSKNNMCCMPLIPCLPTPFSFLFKAPGIAKWHVLKKKKMARPEHPTLS